jgi:Ala-tRNA(Pro) deacylase
VSTKVDLKTLGVSIGSKGGSPGFASESQLKEVLNLVPGSVTPYGLLNDKDSKVQYFLDKVEST